jgi:hypothetical protein
MTNSFSLLIAVFVMVCCSSVRADDIYEGRSGHNPTTATAVSSTPAQVIGTPAATEQLALFPAVPDESASSSLTSVTVEPPISTSAIVKVPSYEAESAAIQWRSLINDSFMYLGVMHSFRIATERGTREGLHNSMLGGYLKALGAMHGWSDGDTNYENYLGHPIQGAVSGYLWIHNDPRYRAVQFGASRDYWMSRLRAYGFAWAFSEQFEIGLISEASIGQIQRYCCAYGFVDHIITPNGGLVWMLGEDALDRYVTVPIENHTRSTALRILARVALNPPQSFANLMMFQYPWRRENRATVSKYDGEMHPLPPGSLAKAVSPDSDPRGFNIPKFELAAAVPGVYQVGGLACLGGGGVAALRATDFWQWTMEVSGCTLGNSLPQYWSGDSLTFTFGPQWIVHTAGRWSPHAHFRIGGQKITEEQVNPTVKKLVLSQLPPGAKKSKYRDLHTQDWETTGLSLSMGGGLDIAINRALAVRVANLDYTRSWLGTLNGTDFDRGFRFSSGLVLRVGTW